MQYLRSRNSTARANFENGKVDKMPKALKHEVENNLKKYFDLWLKCGGNWKEIQLHAHTHTDTCSYMHILIQNWLSVSDVLQNPHFCISRH